MDSAESTTADRRVDGGIALALVLAVAGVHANAIGAAFQFDDFAVIVDNPAVHSVQAWWRSMPGIRPLLKLGYALNHALWPGAVGFHAINVAIHVANALLAWRLSLAWLPRLGVEPLAARRAAPVAALLFALHPAATEAVACASGRSISLAAFFMLACWLADVRAQAGGPSRNMMSALLFAAALATRETSVVAPAALLLLAACARDVSWRQVLIRLSGHAIVLALAAAAALASGSYQRFIETSLHARDATAQWLSQLHAHAYLVTTPLLRLRTNIDPPLPPVTTIDAIGAATLGCIVLLAGAMPFARRRWPWLAFALLWYLLQLAPTNSLLPRLDLANDRHLYLAVLGPAWIVAVVLAQWRHRLAATGIAGLLLVTLGVASVRRNADYVSEITLWTASIRADPNNPRAWNNLGFAWRNAGDPVRAQAAYLCALTIDPGYAQAILNLDALDSSALSSRASGSSPAETAADELPCPPAMRPHPSGSRAAGRDHRGS